jgi:chorismate synthase
VQQEDIRTTQEIFGDLSGGLASLGARGVDGFVIAKALARLLIQQGIISKETFIATMREVAKEELEDSDEITQFLSDTFTEILEQLQHRAAKTMGGGDTEA